MTRTIWKTALAHTGPNVITMPWPFTILSVGSQGDRRCLWAEVEAENTVMVTRIIEVYGTGWGIPPHPEPKRFLGTVHTGPYVWHVYERGEGSTNA